MFRRLHVLAVAAFCLACVPATFAQGGQGGSADLGDADTGVFTHILTPGDRGEWPVTAKEGETFIVQASSAVFDPALEIIDAGSKVLVQNDDIAAGKQDALVVFRAPTAGDYKILVKAFKSVAGGQYRLTLRRFIPTEVKIGPRTAGAIGKTGVQWLRFASEGNETMVVSAMASANRPAIEVFQPNGEQLAPSDRGAAGQRTHKVVFRANQKGDYHIRLNAGVTSSFAVTIVAARVGGTAIDGPAQTRKLDSGGLDIWTFDGKVGDLITVDAKSSNAGVEATLAGPRLRMLPSSRKAAGRVSALLTADGKFEISISQPLDLPSDYSVSVVHSSKPMAEGQEIGTALKLGESEYWTFEGKSGQIVRLEGWASQFDLTLTLFDPHGEAIASNDDGGGGENPLITALLAEPGRYILRASAYGEGGSGSYKIKRMPNPVKPLVLNGGGEGVLGAGGTEIWSFQGKAGQTVLISARSKEFDVFLELFGPDGLEVASNEDSGESTDSLISVRLPVDGVYTIWVGGRQGSGKYAIRLIDLD